MNNFILKKKELLPMIIFLTYVSIYILVLLIFPMGSESSQLRYFALGFGIVVGILGLIKKFGLNFLKKTKNNELLYIVLLGLIFLIISYFIAKSYNKILFFRTYIQIFLMISPALFAYCLLNLMDMKTIFKCLKIVFLLSVILYFFENKHMIIDFFNFDNYKSFFTGDAFTESSLFSEIFLQLFLIFNYFAFVNKNEKFKVSKITVFVSGLFTILCWKRLAVLMIICIPFVNLLLKKNKDKNLSLLLIIIISLIVSFGTVIYTKTLQHLIFNNFDIFKFSTGRDYILSLWEKHNYISYGYGSSMILIGRYLELDLVEIYLELNIVCLFLFVFFYFLQSKENRYGFIIMFYSMINMLTASSLPYSLGWIILFISLKMINNISKEEKYE